MTDTLRPRLLLVGDFSGAELATVAASIASRAAAHTVADINQALLHLAQAAGEPDVIVLACPRPATFAAKDLNLLRRAAPLARQLAVLGTWCEGELRSGQVVPGVIRTTWHQWVPHWAGELELIVHARLPAWGLPETANEEERLLNLAERAWPQRQGMIAISSRSYETAELLADACRRRGYATVWLRQLEEYRIGRASAILWDGHVDLAPELTALKRALPAPVVALIDFPRIEFIKRLAAAGADATLAKPLVLDDLFWHLDQLVGDVDATRHVA